MIMRSLLCFLVLVSTVTADCSPSMCENGSCIDGECQCEPNYTGANCSIPFETCEDGELTCLHGSTCSVVRNNNNNDNDVDSNTYYCDCTNVYGSSLFAGLQCDQAATSYCVEGSARSKYAFCTNGGICERIVPGGSPHPGCKCSEEFEGMQCQYVKGQAPAEDLGQPYQMVMPQGGSSGDEEGVAIFLLVIICIGVIVGLGYVLYRRRKSRRKETTTSTGVTTASAADEPDAEII